jgi:hypothetical protein
LWAVRSAGRDELEEQNIAQVLLVLTIPDHASVLGYVI